MNEEDKQAHRYGAKGFGPGSLLLIVAAVSFISGLTEHLLSRNIRLAIGVALLLAGYSSEIRAKLFPAKSQSDDN